MNIPIKRNTILTFISNEYSVLSAEDDMAGKTTAPIVTATAISSQSNTLALNSLNTDDNSKFRGYEARTKKAEGL